MKILLVAATQNEIAPYLHHNHKHDILITGVGVPTAMYSLTKHLAHHRYDVVVQAGIAGANVNMFPLGSMVVVGKDCFAGLGAWENNSFTNLQQMQMSNEPIWYKGDDHWIKRTQLPVAEGATVSTITNNEEFIAAMQAQWPCSIESMEGAALYYVCHQMKQAAVQVRCISNAIGDRNKQNWQIENAISNCNNFLLHWLGQ